MPRIMAALFCISHYKIELSKHIMDINEVLMLEIEVFLLTDYHLKDLCCSVPVANFLEALGD